MHIRLAFGLLLVFLVGCNDGHRNGVGDTTATGIATTDTVVARKTITDEIPGAAYRKKAIGFFVVVGKDTSDYMCVVTESKDGGRVGIHLNIPYNKPEMTYRQRLEELGTILPEAAKEFDFDSLAGIFFGRLILSGDLAVDVTKQYHR